MKDLQDFVAECRRLRASNSPNMVLCLDFIRYKVCNPRETIALCYLMSLPVDDDGWAAVSVSQWQHEFNLTAQMQSRLLRALKSRGLVEVAMRGMPAKRVVRVDLMSIWNTALETWTEEKEFVAANHRNFHDPKPFAYGIDVQRQRHKFLRKLMRLEKEVNK